MVKNPPPQDLVKLKQIMSRLKEEGYRNTRTRRALLDLLLKAEQPLDFSEIDQGLQDRGLGLNKSTIYRELDFLKERHLVRTVLLGDRKDRFELEGEEHHHHHHLVCKACGKVECIELAACLDQELEAQAQAKGFVIQSHNLEVFGLCNQCGPPAS